MAVVNSAQRKHIDLPMHYIFVHRPFAEVACNRDGQHHQPSPSGVIELPETIHQQTDAHRIHHAHMQQAVVKRTDVGAVSFSETTLPLGHRHGFGKTGHACLLSQVWAKRFESIISKSQHQQRPEVIHIGVRWAADHQVPQGFKQTVTVIAVCECGGFQA